MTLKNEATLSWLALRWSGRRHSDKCRYLDRRIKLNTYSVACPTRIIPSVITMHLPCIDQGCR